MPQAGSYRQAHFFRHLARGKGEILLPRTIRRESGPAGFTRILANRQAIFFEPGPIKKPVGLIPHRPVSNTLDKKLVLIFKLMLGLYPRILIPPINEEALASYSCCLSIGEPCDKASLLVNEARDGQQVDNFYAIVDVNSRLGLIVFFKPVHPAIPQEHNGANALNLGRLRSRSRLFHEVLLNRKNVSSSESSNAGRVYQKKSALL